MLGARVLGTGGSAWAEGYCSVLSDRLYDNENPTAEDARTREVGSQLPAWARSRSLTSEGPALSGR